MTRDGRLPKASRLWEYFGVPTADLGHEAAPGK